jgi:type IV pilus assembly protein PilM
VQNRAEVTAALKRLWKHGRFSGKEVVIGLGSQRAMVRQVEMPPMSDSELRSALKFKMGEFLPIPVEQAVVDFAPLPAGEAGDGRRRLLLVAAQREVVVDEVAAVEAAGLRVKAVDSSSLALLRAVTQRKGPGRDGHPGGGLEAIVGIGAALITVAVREGGVPRFVRTVALPGSASPEGIDASVAAVPGERARHGSRSAQPVGLVDRGASKRLEAIVGEVRSSLEYLLSQSETGSFDQVLLTGGGAMLAGVTGALSTALGLPVSVAELSLQVDHKALGLEGDALKEASNRWLTAVGLALWGTDAYGKPSLLPAEVMVRRQQRRMMAAAATGVVAVVAGLGAVSYSRVQSADGIRTQVQRTHVEALALQKQIDKLGYVLEIPAEVQSRRALAVTALSGDINWTGLLGRVAAAMPADFRTDTVGLTKNQIALTGATVAPGGVVGTFAMTAETTGGAKAVAAFIDRMSRVRGLQALWVASTTNAAGLTTVQASAQVTTLAFGSRVAALPGGSK